LLEASSSQPVATPFISRRRVTMALLRGIILACPYFVPREILNDGSWPHPSRLPLGAGWSGSCCALGQTITPSDTLLREFCNLGYAAACPHLPSAREWDAVRFSVASSGCGQVTFRYVCELGHAPVEYGNLTFDLRRETWVNVHSDCRVQRLAECYLETYRARQSHAFIE
jgi:hypothetical protein